MRSSCRLLSVAAALGLALAITGAARAESVMKACGAEWQQAKAAGTTNSETWPQFLAQCRAQQKTASMGGGTATAPPAMPTAAPSYGQAPGSGKTTRDCDEEYSANKATIRASGQTKREFVASCRAGSETSSQGSAAAPPPAPRASNSGSLFPWLKPTAAAPTSAPAPANYGATPAPTAAGEFSSEQQARYRFPSDTIVWVNTKSRVYHFSGTGNYGNTKHGAYMCEADAKASGIVQR